MANQEKKEDEATRNILIAIDGSQHAGRAFDFYMKAVRREGDKVILFHAFELPPLPYSSGPFVFAYYEEWRAMVKEEEDKHKAMLRSFEDMCKETKGLHYKALMVIGKPAGEVICEIAKEEGVDLVIIGSRGLSLIRRTILGSVSDYVVHHLHKPVAVVPGSCDHQEHAN